MVIAMKRCLAYISELIIILGIISHFQKYGLFMCVKYHDTYTSKYKQCNRIIGDSF